MIAARHSRIFVRNAAPTIQRAGASVASAAPHSERAAAASVKRSDDAPVRVADTSAPENIDGERKTVTALFADIKGSMDLMEDLDPEEARAIVDPH